MRNVTLTLSSPTPALPEMLRRAIANPATIFISAFEVAKLWQRRFDQRRHLAGLEPRLRVDAGLTEDVIARETAKPFWQA